MSRHRAPLRPRYGRIAAAAGSAVITAVSVLGGVGLLGSGSGAATARTSTVEAPDAAARPVLRTQALRAGTTLERARRPWQPVDRSVPADSGEGRRVVFSESRQQVWLVEDHDRVLRTYLVSGSVHDNLDPGSFEVYSRSADAIGVDDSGTMRYFVRFTRGENAAIGFHDIPVDDGERVQTLDQLGIPLSHGCIRQRRRDAIALWEFAPLGTTVLVTA